MYKKVNKKGNNSA